MSNETCPDCKAEGCLGHALGADAPQDAVTICRLRNEREDLRAGLERAKSQLAESERKLAEEKTAHASTWNKMKRQAENLTGLNASRQIWVQRAMAAELKLEESERKAARLDQHQRRLADLLGMNHEPSMGPVEPASWEALLAGVEQSLAVERSATDTAMGHMAQHTALTKALTEKVARLEAERGQHCAACGAVWLPDSGIDELSDLVEPYRQKVSRLEAELEKLEESERKLAESEAKVAMLEGLFQQTHGCHWSWVHRVTELQAELEKLRGDG